MTPVFCPTNNVYDLGRLRLVGDGISFSPNFAAMVATGIQAFVSQLGSQVSIINLNLTAPQTPSDYVIYVGDGNGTRARQPNGTLRIAYVAPDHGYLFITDTAQTVSHEFGHLLGLADRYYEGYSHTPLVVGTRTSIAMDGILFPNEPDYNPATNLMSSPSPNWSLTQAQRTWALTCTEEDQFTRRVVFLLDTTGSQGASWAWPPTGTMYLQGGELWTPDGPPPPDFPIAGYSLLGGIIFLAKASKTSLKNAPVRDLWNLRARVDAAGNSATRKTWFRKGKKHKGKRTVATGPRIHRQMMKNIGNLAT
jgi:hypothetical protein